jgi:hypothetical protein
MVYPALLPTIGADTHASADAPADLSGLIRFAEKRNLLSARVPSHFNWPLQRNIYKALTCKTAILGRDVKIS